MKGVADFILAALNYSNGEYTPAEIEELLLLVDAYEEDSVKKNFKLLNLPQKEVEYEDD